MNPSPFYHEHPIITILIGIPVVIMCVFAGCIVFWSMTRGIGIPIKDCGIDTSADRQAGIIQELDGIPLIVFQEFPKDIDPEPEILSLSSDGGCTLRIDFVSKSSADRWIEVFLGHTGQLESPRMTLPSDWDCAEQVPDEKGQLRTRCESMFFYDSRIIWISVTSRFDEQVTRSFLKSIGLKTFDLGGEPRG